MMEQCYRCAWYIMHHTDEEEDEALMDAFCTSPKKVNDTPKACALVNENNDCQVIEHATP